MALAKKPIPEDQENTLAKIAARSRGVAPQPTAPAPVEPPAVKSPEMPDNLTQALLAAAPIVLGAAFGGARGGEVGAKVGGDTVRGIQTQYAADQARADKLNALAQQRSFEREKFESDKGFREKQVAIQERGQDLEEKKTEAQLGIARLKAQVEQAKEKLKNTSDLRKEYNGLDVVQNYRKATDSINKIEQAYKGAISGKAGFDDYALIVNYLKVLDPTSVVREGEFATAQRAQGAMQALGIKIDEFKRGVKLSPEGRQALVQAARNQYSGVVDAFKPIQSDYLELAQKQGIPTKDVFLGASGQVTDERPTFAQLQNEAEAKSGTIIPGTTFDPVTGGVIKSANAAQGPHPALKMIMDDAGVNEAQARHIFEKLPEERRKSILRLSQGVEDAAK